MSNNIDGRMNSTGYTDNTIGKWVISKAQSTSVFIEAITSYDHPRPSLSSNNEIFSSLDKLIVIVNM